MNYLTLDVLEVVRVFSAKSRRDQNGNQHDIQKVVFKNNAAGEITCELAPGIDCPVGSFGIGRFQIDTIERTRVFNGVPGQTEKGFIPLVLGQYFIKGQKEVQSFASQLAAFDNEIKAASSLQHK